MGSDPLIVQIDCLYRSLIEIFSMRLPCPIAPAHRQLQYFVAVAQQGAFPRGRPGLQCLATDAFNAAQASRRPARRGSDRTGRRNGGSDRGGCPKLLPLARTILSGLDEFVEMASCRCADNLGGLVRLGVAPTFGPYFLPHYLPQLHRLYPALEIYIREDRPNTARKPT
jgi:LysR family hydrogen peroxide-inducible transcriptional activator